MVIARLRSLLLDPTASDPPASFDERAFAAVALMIEAASLDGSVDAGERERIRDLAAGHFGLTRAEVDALVDSVEQRMAVTHQLQPFTRVVKDQFSEAERVELCEMLWEVIYADGEAHDYEAGLMRRLGGLIYVSDVDLGAARKRVLARLGRHVEQIPGRAP